MDVSVSATSAHAAPKSQAAPFAADVGNTHASGSRRSARAKAPVHHNQKADTATVHALGREGHKQSAAGKRAVRGKFGGKAKREEGAEEVQVDIETVDVTVTARAAARGAVKRRKPREDITLDVEELLEESVEAAEAATPVKQKRRRKAAAAAAGNDEDSPPKAKQKRTRKGAAATEELTAPGEDDESAPAPKQKRVRKKAAAAEDDPNAVLVDLPTSVPAGKLVGCHVSAAAGVERALVNAVAVGAPPLHLILCSQAPARPSALFVDHLFVPQVTPYISTFFSSLSLFLPIFFSLSVKDPVNKVISLHDSVSRQTCYKTTRHVRAFNKSFRIPKSTHCRILVGWLLDKAIVIVLADFACSGAKAFAMDTRSKRRWECPALKRSTAAAFRSACNTFGFSAAQILPHGETLGEYEVLRTAHHFTKTPSSGH